MSYTRVIPRDFFNEGNLLKCYGQLTLNLELVNADGIVFEHDGEPFCIEQDESSGGTTITNVELIVRGVGYRLYRPLNSREPWPLYLVNESEEELAVFTDTGSFTDEMVAFLKGQ